MGYVILFPIWLGLVLFLLLARQRISFARGMQIFLLSALTLSATVLVLFPEWKASCRLVMILDHEALLTATEMPCFLDQCLKKLKPDYYVVFLLESLDKLPQPLKTGQISQSAGMSIRLKKIKKTWLSGSTSFRIGNESRVLSLDEGIQHAYLQFHERSQWEKLSDFMLGRKQRIIVVSSSEQRWQNLSPIDLGKRLPEVIQEEIIVDFATTELKKPISHLEIIHSSYQLPAAVYIKNIRDSVVLRMTSPIFSQYLEKSVSWKFAGTLSSKDIQFQLHTQKQIEGKMQTMDSGTGKILTTGILEIEVPLQNSMPQDRSLDIGYHLVECKLIVELPEDLTLVVEANAYFCALFRDVFFVIGKDRWAKDQEFNKIMQQIQGFWKKSIDPQLGIDVVQEAYWKKLRKRLPTIIDARHFFNIAEYTTQPKIPFLLVLYDIPDDIWGNPQHPLWTKVNQDIEEGAHLMICGLPKQEDAAKHPFVMAAAVARSTVETGEKTFRAWQVERTPRLTFVLDTSRMGRLDFRPTNQLINPKDLILLSKGMAWQLQIMDAICKSLGLKTPQPNQYIQDQWIKTLCVQTALPANLGKDDLVKGSDIERRLSALLPKGLLSPEMLQHLSLPAEWSQTSQSRPQAHEIAIQDVIVVFTYEVNQAKKPFILPILLARGAVVLIVRIAAPYAKAANHEFQVDSLEQYLNTQKVLDILQQMGPNTLSKISPLALDALQKKKLIYDLSAETYSLKGDRSLNSVDQGKINQIAEAVYQIVHPIYDPRACILVQHQIGRFFDETLGKCYPHLSKLGDENIEPGDRWAGPMSFQILQPQDNPLATCYASAWDTLGNQEHPLIFGGIYGRNLVLCLGYSIFDKQEVRYHRFMLQEQIFSPTYLSKFDPTAACHDRFGPQRVIDFAVLCQSLEKIPGNIPQLAEVKIVNTRGQLRFLIIYQLQSGQQSPTLYLETADGTQQNLSLVHLDFERQASIYELFPSQLKKLLNQAPSTWVSLKYRRSDGPQTQNVVVAQLFIKGPATITEFIDLSSIASVEALTRYSGGNTVENLEHIPVYCFSNRIFSSLIFVLCLAILWGMRAIRKINHSRQRNQKMQQESQRYLLEDSGPGLVAQVGESIGRPVSSVKAGAFAGYRPWEPGDQLNSALMDDVMLMSGFHKKIIPRIIQRMDERSSRVMLLVNVGRSMRIPKPFMEIGPKILCAIRIAQIVAEMAWSKSAELSLGVTGLEQFPEPLGPYFGDPGADEFEKYLLAQAAQKASWQVVPQIPIFDEGTKVVYISDFILENWQHVLQQTEILQEDGGGFAGVYVYSKAELKLLDICVAPNARLLCDRSEWTDLDLAQAYQNFAKTLEETFDGTEGGLTTISASMNSYEMLDAFRSSRLLEVLR